MFITGGDDPVVSNTQVSRLRSLLPDDCTPRTNNMHICFTKLDHCTFFDGLILPRVNDVILKWFNGKRNAIDFKKENPVQDI